MKRLIVNPVPCTGCLSCEAVCALSRAGIQDRSAASFRVSLDIFRGSHSHSCCRHCPAPACAEACPSGAMSLDPSTGIASVERERCIGCGACTGACPFGVLFMWGGERWPAKCDLCGGSPRCVDACRFGVIGCLESVMPVTGLEERDDR